MEIKVEHINPFLMASTSVLKATCDIGAKIGKPYLRDSSYENETVTIVIGLIGELSGQTIIAFPYKTACYIASKMMMMTVEHLDEMSRSAISELGNMIMGNVATVFSTQNIGVDITPPVMMIGIIELSNNFTKNICIPVDLGDGHTMEINVSIKTEKK